MFVLAVFFFVYLGMMLGCIPGLALDRTGIAIVGAMALIATGIMTPVEAWNVVDVSTMSVLFGLMLISAQLSLGGFYTAVTQRLGRTRLRPGGILALLIGTSGALAAVLSNDIVCLAAAPVVLDVTHKRNLNPVPFLVALALAANTGSAATLIGNPQNILIGEHFGLSFARYLLDAALPATLGLFFVWASVTLGWHHRLEGWPADCSVPAAPLPEFSIRHTAKGLLVLVVVIVFFLKGSPPRDVVALAAGAFLLLNRRLTSRRLFALVDWNLLLLFIGLFVVTHALVSTGFASDGLDFLSAHGLSLSSPFGLVAVTLLASNIFSNVPAVMLLLHGVSGHGGAVLLALISTFSGNLLLVGSIANIIVVSVASGAGINIGWRSHARAGVPVTFLLLLFSVLWLKLKGTI